MDKPSLFVEICAGTAALSVRLQGGRRRRPPISRMGSKAGYADVILDILGLQPGQGAGSYLWCDPDPGCRALLMSYAQPSVLKAAADKIRGWNDEDPRALWERLRSVPINVPKSCVIVDGAMTTSAEGLASLLVAWAGNSPQNRWRGPCKDRDCVGFHPSLDSLAERLEFPIEWPSTMVTDEGHIDPMWISSFLVRTGWSNGSGRAYYGPDHKSRLHGEGWTGSITLEGISSRLESLSNIKWPPAVVTGNLEEEVASWIVQALWAFRRGIPNAGNAPCLMYGTDKGSPPVTCAAVSERVKNFDVLFPPVGVLSGFVMPEGVDLSDVIVYIDPPYVGTTGYDHDLPRSEVVRIARAWRDAGALVCISEAEPIPELVDDGWWVEDITHDRRGTARTFSLQQREFLTLSRPPERQQSVLDLFGEDVDDEESVG